MSLFDKALGFALRKAGRDSDFSLKAQQKEIIETIACLKNLRCVRDFTDRIHQQILPTGFRNGLMLLWFEN